jgi:hypothetical protein
MLISFLMMTKLCFKIKSKLRVASCGVRIKSKIDVNKIVCLITNELIVQIM